MSRRSFVIGLLVGGPAALTALVLAATDLQHSGMWITLGAALLLVAIGTAASSEQQTRQGIRRSVQRATFVERWIRGDAQIAAVDDFIDAWHQDPDDVRHLHDALGLSCQEYARWVQDPDSLHRILLHRQAAAAPCGPEHPVPAVPTSKK